jgi:hypothetical protein
VTVAVFSWLLQVGGFSPDKVQAEACMSKLKPPACDLGSLHIGIDIQAASI